ncbi:Ger(x)C family spore germination protein [Cohnella luojiensis]|uniref:Ger(X)C family spore germination protein n=1 Tax=Cohnella luojiensis TaxID=652876 RepID=A0A4Y8M4W0_9BACL|nr:Ger(x)C family spore germination protein [Cohnella luojiensis]TFE30670.1 Ger(x)C family spore germination protein [Cohnella luojiensis]
MNCTSYSRSLLISLIFLGILFLTGCWSSNEIDKLSVYVGVALDTGKVTDIENKLEEQGGRYPKKDLMTSTIQILTPQAAGAANKGGQSKQKPYANISETGDSLFEMIREVSLRTDKPLIGHHLKVVVIGDDLARNNNIEHLLDFFFRDNDIRPSCLVFMSSGRAIETLKSKSPDDVPAFKIAGIADNQYRISKILPPMSLGKLKGEMQSGSSFLLQNVISANGEMKFAGAAVIQGKTKKLLGFLDEQQLNGVIWLTGKGKGGLVKSFDEMMGRLITYEIKSMKSTIHAYVDGNDISFRAVIKSEGRLIENWTAKGAPSKNKFLRRAEKAFEQEVEQMIDEVLKKTQKDMGVDVLGFGNRLRIEHPNTWEKVKRDWDKTFREATVKLEVKLSIEDYGAIIDSSIAAD